jgi:acyl-CoA reductase-like NAD-dependent aldehyde dehydrogenase
VKHVTTRYIDGRFVPSHGRQAPASGPPCSDAPFGGFKQSGTGRESGRFGLDEYLEYQAIFAG